MKNISHEARAGAATILFATDKADIPTGLQSMKGVLVWRDTPHVLAYWDPSAKEWCPLNAAGTALTLGISMPAIPSGCWAIITAPTLEGRVIHRKYTVTNLLYALAACMAQAGEAATTHELERLHALFLRIFLNLS